MRKEYDFSGARRNPYARRLKRPITLRLEVETIAYFKRLAEQSRFPYQSLINLYLRDCAASGRRLRLSLATIQVRGCVMPLGFVSLPLHEGRSLADPVELQEGPSCQGLVYEVARFELRVVVYAQPEFHVAANRPPNRHEVGCPLGEGTQVDEALLVADEEVRAVVVHLDFDRDRELAAPFRGIDEPLEVFCGPRSRDWVRTRTTWPCSGSGWNPWLPRGRLSRTRTCAEPAD